MTKYAAIYILMLMCLLPAAAGGAERNQYSELVGKVKDLPSEKIMQLAGKYAEADKDGEAIVLYAVVYGRYSPSMDDKAKNTCASARQKAGMLYYNRGDYAGALGEFINGVKTSGQCRNPEYLALLYKNIGNVYCVFFDYEKGIDYYLKAYWLCRKGADREVEHDILVNLAGTYTFTGDKEKAWKYYRLSEKTKNPDDPVDVFMSGFSHSLLQLEEEPASHALERLKGLAAYAAANGLEPKYQCFAYQELYIAYQKAGVPDSTLKYLRLCDETAQKYGLQHTFAATLKAFSDFYMERGDKDRAYAYKSRYLDFMDSVCNVREFDVVKNQLFTYEVDNTKREISELRTREEESARTVRAQRTAMAAVTLGCVLLAVFLFIVVRQKRRLDRSYADLYAVNREFMDSHARLAERLRKAAETISEKDALIASFGKKAETAATDTAERQTEAAKYSGSNLDDAQRLALADAIQNVMENTTAFCAPNFTLDELARLVGSNSTYVSQAINDTFNKNFSNYVNPYRIHLACARLEDKAGYGHLTMKAIGESVGFKSYTSFVNTFRKVTGITPALYSKMAKRGEDARQEHL